MTYPVNTQDKQIIIDWLADTSPKGIMECTDITANSADISGFIARCVDELRQAITEGRL